MERDSAEICAYTRRELAKFCVAAKEFARAETLYKSLVKALEDCSLEWSLIEYQMFVGVFDDYLEMLKLLGRNDESRLVEEQQRKICKNFFF